MDELLRQADIVRRYYSCGMMSLQQAGDEMLTVVFEFLRLEQKRQDEQDERIARLEEELRRAKHPDWWRQHGGHNAGRSE